MLARELITDEIPPLKLSDSIGRAIQWMDEFKVAHLPVVKNGELLGIVSEMELIDQGTSDKTISKANPELVKASVSENKHIFDVVKAISEQKLSVIPVLGENNRYLGAISLARLMNAIADMAFVKEQGSIIILEMNINDYTLSEIAQIAESNDARILGMFVTAHSDSTKMHLTIKVNRTEIGALLSTFERYSYNVTASYDQGEVKEDLKNRYDALMNYLNF